MKAHDILNAAAKHMEDRSSTYDKPEGERSMRATVEAFEAVTGLRLTEEQGWLFMALLKAVRSQQGALRMDSYEDGAAYFALAGEAASAHRKKTLKRVLYDDDTEKRMDVLGQNGNTAEHCPSGEWTPNNGKEPDLPDGTLVDVKLRSGSVGRVHYTGTLRWSLTGTYDDITHYRIHQPE